MPADVQPPSSASPWDGLVSTCGEYLAAHPEHLADKYIARWHRAAQATVETS